jgi:hypothetical protein
LDTALLQPTSGSSKLSFKRYNCFGVHLRSNG